MGLIRDIMVEKERLLNKYRAVLTNMKTATNLSDSVSMLWVSVASLENSECLPPKLSLEEFRYDVKNTEQRRLNNVCIDPPIPKLKLITRVAASPKPSLLRTSL